MPGPARATLLKLAVFLCAASHGPAQQPDPAPPIPLGSVLAHVYDGATGLPIRSAEVLLVPKPDNEPNAPGTAQPAARKQLRIQNASGYSDLNGDANLGGVPAGEYFVSAIHAAYLTPADQSIFSASPDQVNALVAALPSVRVAPGAAVSIGISLHRGAVISGRIQFADGSPAIGFPVTAESPTPVPLTARLTPDQQMLLSLSASDSRRNEPTTDDQGRYRISALRPGAYIVTTGFAVPYRSADLTMNYGVLPGRHEHVAPQLVSVFYPGIFRRADAKRIRITASEEIANADITIDTSGLHTVRGKVFAGEDRHIPSQAFLFLRDHGSSDPIRFVGTEDDGSFQIDDLPPGSYSIVAQGNDQEPPQSNDPAAPSPRPTLYKPSKVSFTITDGDRTLDDIVLSPQKPGEPFQDPF